LATRQGFLDHTLWLRAKLGLRKETIEKVRERLTEWFI